MSEDEIEFNPFDYVEEDREVLEALAEQRRAAEANEFPRHLLTSDPVWAREVVRKAKAEKVIENAKDYSWGAPEIPARPAEPDEWPRAAKTLTKKLDGWRRDGWFMRGPVISSQNRERRIASAFVLKADHPAGRRLRVIFHLKEAEDAEAKPKWDRKADWIYTPEHHVTWSKAASVKALEEYAAEPDLAPAEPITLEEA